jgi:hypothetical protein
VKRIKGNADRQKNVEMRRLINDAAPREEPLKIFEQKVPVFEKPEHAQVHADTGNQPDATGMFSFCLRDSGPEPKVHCRRGKEERGKGRIPRAIKNVAGDDEQVFPRVPTADAPIERYHDREKNYERERIEKHEVARFLSEKGRMVSTFLLMANPQGNSTRVTLLPVSFWQNRCKLFT